MSARSGPVGVASRGWHARDDPLEQLVDADPFLGAHQQDLVGGDAQEVHDLLPSAFRLGARQVDLIEDRDDGQAGVEREEQVGERLGLDALRGVDDEDRALARGQRPRHLVRKVDVAGRVDQVELIRLAVAARCSSSGRRST